MLIPYVLPLLRLKVSLKRCRKTAHIFSIRMLNFKHVLIIANNERSADAFTHNSSRFFYRHENCGNCLHSVLELLIAYVLSLLRLKVSLKRRRKTALGIRMLNFKHLLSSSKYLTEFYGISKP